MISAPNSNALQRIRHVEFVDAILKSPSGKILRRVLVERERASQTSASGHFGPRVA
jgi:acyl-CoA synthetase (AMP-forming)/AMP-acid ligase II